MGSGSMWKENLKSLNYELSLVPNFTLYSLPKGGKMSFHLDLKAENPKYYFKNLLIHLKNNIKMIK